jgi:hypothetical protein
MAPSMPPGLSSIPRRHRSRLPLEEALQHVPLAIAEGLRRQLRYKLPRMTAQNGGEPRHPFRRQLTLAKFKVADLLVGSTNPIGQFPESEAASLTLFPNTIRQKCRSALESCSPRLENRVTGAGRRACIS